MHARERLDVLMSKGEPVTGQWNYDADNREPLPKRRGTLGLDPVEIVRAAEDSYAEGHAPIAAVEGFVRQIIGWRDYIWNLYWYLGEDYRNENALGAHTPIPDWFAELDPSGTDARCLSWALSSVREVGWAHSLARRGNAMLLLGPPAVMRS